MGATGMGRLASSAGQGAASGAMLGPYGALAGAGLGLLSGLSSGKGARRSPIHRDLVRAQRSGLNLLTRDISGGGSPLLQAGARTYETLLGQGGLGLADLGPLGEMALSGSPADIHPLVTATKDVAFRNIDEQAAALQSQFGAAGGRYSSDVYRGAGLVRERGLQNLNETLARLGYGAAEEAAQRRLAASQLLGNLAGSARQSALSPVALALGRDIPDIQPGPLSQGFAAAAPLATYALANRTGGK